MGIDMNKKCLGLILLAGVAGIFSEIQAGDGPSTPDRIQKKQLTQSPPPNINESLIRMENEIDIIINDHGDAKEVYDLCIEYRKFWATYGQPFRTLDEVMRVFSAVSEYTRLPVFPETYNSPVLVAIK